MTSALARGLAGVMPACDAGMTWLGLSWRARLRVGGRRAASGLLR
jgi:hypothetical protein